MIIISSSIVYSSTAVNSDWAFESVKPDFDLHLQHCMPMSPKASCHTFLSLNGLA